MLKKLRLDCAHVWTWCAVALAAISPVAAASQSTAASADTLTLAALLRAANQHPLADAAAARIQAARGARISAGVLGNPMLTYQEEGDDAGAGQGTATMPKERMTFAMLPLEPLWQRWPRVRRANEELRAASSEAEQTRRLITVEAVRRYLDAGVAQVASDVTRVTEASLDTVVQFNRARVGEGVTAESDLIRVQLELSRASAERATAEAELARALARVVPYVSGDTRGAPRTTPTRIAVQTPAIVAAAQLARDLPPLEGVRTRALDRRPDVIAARARARAARAGISVERSMLLRELNLMAGSMEMAGERAPMIGITLPVPLFDQNRGGVTRASAEARIAARELEWLERQAQADVDAAHEAAAVLQRALRELSTDLVARAEEVQRIALAAYREGAVTILHVIDATRAAREARLTYERLTTEWLKAMLDLHLVSGTDPAAIAGGVR